MKKVLFIFCLIFFFSKEPLAYCQCGTNLLINAGFDSPAQPNQDGDNITGFSFNGWTSTNGKMNIVETNGGYTSGPAYAKDGNQYADIASAGGTIYQNFTVSGAALPFDFGGYFSSRAPDGRGYTDWTGSIQIYTKSGTLMATSTTRAFTSADGAGAALNTWYQLYGSVTLPPGKYRFVINLGDWGNFDAAYLFTDCILPARVIYFRSCEMNNTVLLNWKLDDASGLSFIDVEKSADGIHFDRIDNIHHFPGQTSTATDAPAETGAIIYYRLKLVDINGKIFYSDVIRQYLPGLPGDPIVSPNPVYDHLCITGMGNRESILLLDITGRPVAAFRSTANTVSIDVSGLAPGIYSLVFTDGRQKRTKKFVRR